MGLMENLAKMAIRNKVLGMLRNNCPEQLKADLEELLSDNATVDAIQGLATSCFKNGRAITAAAIMGLPLREDIKRFLETHPALMQYLLGLAPAK